MVIADPGRASPFLMRVQGQLLGAGSGLEGGDFLS